MPRDNDLYEHEDYSQENVPRKRCKVQGVVSNIASSNTPVQDDAAAFPALDTHERHTRQLTPTRLMISEEKMLPFDAVEQPFSDIDFEPPIEPAATRAMPNLRPTTPPFQPLSKQIISPHGARWLDAQMSDNPVNLGLIAWGNLQATGGAQGEVEEDIWRQMEPAKGDDWMSEQHRMIYEDEPVYTPTDTTHTIQDPRLPPSTIAPDTISISRSSKKVVFADPDSASESEDSIDSLEPHAPPALLSYDNEAIGVPERRSAEELSDFILGFALWCESKGITRRDYSALRDVLCLSNIPEIEKLPTRLSTLLTWERTRLPIPGLCKAKVPILTKKQPTNTTGKTAAIYFMDVRVLVSMLLSTRDVAQRVHFGMADVVQSPTELYHADCWGSSVRTCGSDIARYPWNQAPIFPSDFVRYKAKDGSVSIGRVFFFGRDRRLQSATINQVILRVQQVLRNEEDTGYILYEDQIFELLESQIVSQQPIKIMRKTHAQHTSSNEFVRQISKNSKLRPASRLKPIRAELEIEQFGRQHLTSKLQSGVQSFPLMCFIDSFGLYRNMYRSLCGIYLLPAGLSLEERQRTSNVYPITLGPHGSKLDDVVHAIQNSIQALEQGCKILIHGQDKIVWSPILAYTGDMQGQQEAAGFMSGRAEHSCRMCNCDGQNRDDMDLDLDVMERNHYEIEALREEAKKMKTVAREKFFSRHGLLSQPSLLQTMTPALDLIYSRPGDPAHSEFAGIVRRIMPVLCVNILTPKALGIFTDRLRGFRFPPGWGRIQSPETHMKSWTMSECARASVVIPILLRCWPLTNLHIRSEYREALKRHCSEDMIQFNAADIVIRNLGKIAKSNSLVATSSLSVEDRHAFQSHILDARRGFQVLMNASKFRRKAPKKPTKIIKPKAKKTPASRRPQSIADINSQQSMSDAGSVVNESASQCSEGASQVSDGVNQTEQYVSLEDKMAALPNVHVALHFPALIQEYGLLWNVNALPGERMHKFFKAAVQATNHRKVERQLLLKSCIQITVRLALRGAFDITDPGLSAALFTFRERCPHLFEDLTHQVQDQDMGSQSGLQNKHEFIGSSSHLKPLAHDRIRETQARTSGLLIRMPEDVSNPFFTQLRIAMASYGLRTSALGSKTLKWYRQFSFWDPISTHRISLRKGDFITLCGPRFPQLMTRQYAKIEWIFSHCFPRDDQRRLFAMALLVEHRGERDWLLDLPILQTARTTIISLLEIAPKRTWMVPLVVDDKANSGETLLQCDWDVNFS